MSVQVEQENVPLAYNWTNSSFVSYPQHIDCMADNLDLTAKNNTDYMISLDKMLRAFLPLCF